MKKLIIFGLILTIYSGWFEEGNTAYLDGNYEQAITSYQKIEEAGIASASLFYNMGNTYYKMKDFPHAILYYEKAAKLDPSDEDIQANLAIANLAVVDKINPIPKSFVGKWRDGLRSSLPADGWAWMSVALFALLLTCLLVFLLSRRTGLRKAGFFAGVIVLLCLALSIVLAVDSLRNMTHHDKAIVMTPTVTVKSSPDEQSVDLFVLHEGAKVSILDTSRDWNKIKIADGSVGWLPASDMTEF